jgi:undecaprenyl-diphosphatase
MTTIEAIILAIVEGITEYLPISSTGHMIIAQGLLQMESSSFTKVFLVNIQFGAILAVLVLYYKRFINFKSTDFYVKLLVAFIPAAVLGFLLNKKIDAMLESVPTVAISLIVGGVIIIICDKVFRHQIQEETEPEKETKTYIDQFGIERIKEMEPTVQLSYLQALKVGFFQVIAMIPGVSRSASTIIGGLTQKLTMRQAAEFSFFVGVPTITAAAAYKTLKGIEDINGSNIQYLIIGNIISFVVAMIAVKYFVTYISRHGMKVFGYYRILVGLAILAALYIFHMPLEIIK